MTVHPQAQALLDGTVGATPVDELPLAKARSGMSRFSRGKAGPGPDILAVEDLEIPLPGRTLAAWRYRAVAEPTGTLVFFHGGGWVLLSAADMDATLRMLAARSGMEIVAVDYRLAPEDPYPAAVEDAWEATRWIAARIAGDRPLVVAGDSAGGTLAAVIAIRARDEGAPALAGQVLIYPIADVAEESDSRRELAEGYFFGRKEMAWMLEMYIPDRADRLNPDASPLRAEDHAGLPPALVVTAGYDPLRDEGRAYADALRAAGNEVTLSQYDDMIHGFFTLPATLDRSTEAIDEVTEFLRGR